MSQPAARRSRGGELPRPDFFIVGAPRCGTTFMYEYLRQHPQVFMPNRKEPGFFSTDLDSGSYLDSLSFMRDEAEYLELFRAARPGQRIGEASTWYLYSVEAAGNIARFDPQANILIMLRDPVDMLYSLHGRRVFGGSENLGFSDALVAEEDRRLGLRIPPRARNIKGLYYHDVGRYSAQVERYLSHFGPAQVKVLIFEEFRDDPASTYRETLQFLGLDPWFRPDFQVVNASATRRAWWLQQMLLSPTLVRLARAAIPAALRPRVGPLIDRVNSKITEREPLDPALRLRLREEFHSDVVRLSHLLGRDFTKVWSL